MIFRGQSKLCLTQGIQHTKPQLPLHHLPHVVVCKVRPRQGIVKCIPDLAVKDPCSTSWCEQQSSSRESAVDGEVRIPQLLYVRECIPQIATSNWQMPTNVILPGCWGELPGRYLPQHQFDGKPFTQYYCTCSYKDTLNCGRIPHLLSWVYV